MEKEFLSSAKKCSYPMHASVHQYFQKIGNHGVVKLGVAHLNKHLEVVWYALDGARLSILPAFCDFDKSNYLEKGQQYVFDTIPAGEYFIRRGILYFYTPDCQIKQVIIFWNEDLALLYASFLGVEADECLMIKLFTIDRFRKFVCAAWRLYDTTNHQVMDLPVFAEDQKLITNERGENISFYNFDSDAIEKDSSLLHNGHLWLVKEDPDGKMFIEKTPFAIVRSN